MNKSDSEKPSSDTLASLKKEIDRLNHERLEFFRAERLYMMSGLSFGAAQELGNALSVILGSAEMLSGNIGALTDILRMYRKGIPLPMIQRRERQLRIQSAIDNSGLAATDIVREAEDLVGLIRSMRAFSHDEKPSEFVPSDIGSLVRSAISIIEKSFPGSIEVSVESSGSLTVECGPSLIVQALVTILMAMSDTLCSLEKGTCGRIEIDLIGKPGFVDLRIRDSGPLVAADVLKRICTEPFLRLRPGSGRYFGSGIVLAHDIIARIHGGQLNAANESGRFTITIRISGKGTAN